MESQPGKAWWQVPAILILERLRQEDHELEPNLGYRLIWGTEQFKASLQYIVRFYLKYKGWGWNPVVECLVYTKPLVP